MLAGKPYECYQPPFPLRNQRLHPGCLFFVFRAAMPVRLPHLPLYPVTVDGMLEMAFRDREQHHDRAIVLSATACSTLGNVRIQTYHPYRVNCMGLALLACEEFVDERLALQAWR